MKRRNQHNRKVSERREEAEIRQDKRDKLGDSKQLILLNYRRRRGDSKKEIARLTNKIKEDLNKKDQDKRKEKKRKKDNK